MPEEQTEAAKQWHVTCEDPCTLQSVFVKKGHSLEDVRKFVEQNWCTTLIPDHFMFSWKGEKIGKLLEPFVKVYELASENVEGLKIIEADEDWEYGHLIVYGVESSVLDLCDQIIL